MSEQRSHPEHDQVAQAVRGWFREPFDGMGYCDEVYCRRRFREDSDVEL